MNKAISKPKVLFLATWYPHRNDPMYGLFVAKHAEAVAPFAHLAVLNVQADHNMRHGIYELVSQSNETFPVVTVYFKPSSTGWLNMIRYAVSLWMGYRQIRTKWGMPQIVHQHVLTRMSLLSLWINKRYGIPFIITEHWSRYQPANVSRGTFSGWFRRWLTRYAVAEAHTITTVTKDLKNAMQKLHIRGNYAIVPNVVDTGRFVPSDQLSSGKKYFIHISCFEEVSKNISGTIEAVKLLYETRRDFEVFMVGDGPARKEMLEYAYNLGLTKAHIHFSGVMVGKELV
jgi:glycosyltransferase involved in cell wall biosynthesis